MATPPGKATLDDFLVDMDRGFKAVAESIKALVEHHDTAQEESNREPNCGLLQDDSHEDHRREHAREVAEQEALVQSMREDAAAMSLQKLARLRKMGVPITGSVMTTNMLMSKACRSRSSPLALTLSRSLRGTDRHVATTAHARNTYARAHARTEGHERQAGRHEEESEDRREVRLPPPPHIQD